MAKRETMLDVRSTCECAKIEYCPFEKLVENMADRLFEQYKCMDVFKKKASEKAGKDIGWQAACERWVAEGYAAAFASVWQEGMTHRQLCKAIRGKINKAEDCLLH